MSIIIKYNTHNAWIASKQHRGEAEGEAELMILIDNGNDSNPSAVGQIIVWHSDKHYRHLQTV